MNTKKLLEVMATEGLTCDNLDDAVHEAYAEMAGELNNEGLESQVHFLVTGRGYGPEEVLDWARATVVSPRVMGELLLAQGSDPAFLDCDTEGEEE